MKKRESLLYLHLNLKVFTYMNKNIRIQSTGHEEKYWGTYVINTYLTGKELVINTLAMLVNHNVLIFYCELKRKY